MFIKISRTYKMGPNSGPSLCWWWDVKIILKTYGIYHLHHPKVVWPILSVKSHKIFNKSILVSAKLFSKKNLFPSIGKIKHNPLSHQITQTAVITLVYKKNITACNIKPVVSRKILYDKISKTCKNKSLFDIDNRFSNSTRQVWGQEIFATALWIVWKVSNLVRHSTQNVTGKFKLIILRKLMTTKKYNILRINTFGI